MADFHDLNLPDFIQIFAIGMPVFSTSCVVAASGREVRNADKSFARQKFILKDCRLSLGQFDQFNNFFKARNGKRFAFRLRDYGDYKVNKQIIAIGDGRKREFQLHKLYQDSVSPYYRKITRPAINTLKLFIEEQENSFFEIDKFTGIVTLAEAPVEGKLLAASFEFDVPVRFHDDSFTYKYNQDGSVELTEVELIEVLE